jgi:hypothetical protein
MVDDVGTGCTQCLGEESVKWCFECELTGAPHLGAGFGHSYNGQEQAGRARGQDQGLENSMQRDGKVALGPKTLAPCRCKGPGDHGFREATGGLHQLISSAALETAVAQRVPLS